MKKALKKEICQIYYYDKDGKRIDGVPADITGDLTGIRGDLTNITGDLTDISGNLSGISGDLTDIRGDLTGVSGDISDCEITEEERKKGIDIKDLIK